MNFISACSISLPKQNTSMGVSTNRNRVRLHKVIARAGVASRREAEDWIRAGRVSVNGKIITELGTQVDVLNDVIAVDGRVLPASPAFYYYLFHKPRNVLVARRDPRKRPLIYDYLKDLPTLLHPVGRLDFDSEGLLLLTNDGALAHALTHPSSQVPKRYQVKVVGHVSKRNRSDLANGIVLDDGPARAEHVELLKTSAKSCWLELIVTEGRNRLIRRMCEAIGHPVLRLRRVAVAGVSIKGLGVGRCRPLREGEVLLLQKAKSLKFPHFSVYSDPRTVP
jgi:pseudouridine synthase